MSKQFTQKEWEFISDASIKLPEERITRSLFNTDYKIYMDEQDPHSLFVEVSGDSIRNEAIHIGYQTPDQKVIVCFNEIEKLIETLKIIKSNYIKL